MGLDTAQKIIDLMPHFVGFLALLTVFFTVRQQKMIKQFFKKVLISYLIIICCIYTPTAQAAGWSFGGYNFFLSRLCGGEDCKRWCKNHYWFLSRLCGGEVNAVFF